MQEMEATFTTDTATLCVCDPAAMKHRLSAPCDWWSIPSEELLEVNRGNVAFFGLGSDGTYTVEVMDSDNGLPADCSMFLRVPSGRVFFGAGEEVTSDGIEPCAIRGGAFIDLMAGVYRLGARRISKQRIAITFSLAEHNSTNNIPEQMHL